MYDYHKVSDKDRSHMNIQGIHVCYKCLRDNHIGKLAQNSS